MDALYTGRKLKSDGSLPKTAELSKRRAMRPALGSFSRRLLGLRQELAQQIGMAQQLVIELQTLGDKNGAQFGKGGLEVVIDDDVISFGVVRHLVGSAA